ncbi:MAG TPA: hypothetical protein VNX68_07960, partial [Nitrosopumilaceae archaeon]|nr:hypothetical protein [Nitrosopumilaceae archaeon]
NSNDGMQINQTGGTASVLWLKNTSAGGRTFGLFSTANGNTTEGAGNFHIYDGTSAKFIFFIKGSTDFVGINNISPLAQLSVNGSALFSNTSSSPTSAAYIRGNSAYSTAITPEYTWWNNDQAGLFHPGVNIMGFTTNGTERARIDANGNVGINYNNPTEKLQIDNGVLKLSSPNSYGGPMMLFAGSPTSSYVGDWGIEYRPAAQGNPGLNFWKPFGSPNFGNNYLFLADNGHVGINTNNPTAQFTVNGNVVIGDPAAVCIPNTNYKLFVQTGILTEKVKVAVNCSADWADYVFDEKYKLKSISELESFIKANKHLPNVPSAEEVVKEGIDMATMDAKLLEKIEELSLYIIELKKENTELSKRVEKIEKK